MKGEGIFSVMDKLDLTTLEIFQSRMDNRFLMKGMKEWDDGLEFRHYGKNFSYVDMLTENYKAVGTEELVAGFREMGLGDYLDRVKQLLSEGRHEGIEFFYHRKKDIRVSFCKHSVTLGLENRQHVMRAGAMRRHEPDEPEIEVIVDGLNLSRAMTYKNAVSALPYGGCKTVVQCAPVKLDDYETMGFLSYVPDRCRVFVGADMGLDEEMVDVIRSTFTRNFVGGTKSPLASTGTPTAYGEFLAIKEACDITFDTRDLSGRTIAIQGLGHVGFPLAEYLLDDGAGLIVTDIDRDKVGALQGRYGTDLVRYVSPDEIYTVEADIFSPCAMGGIITEERIPQFSYKIILGSANNQLKATSKDAEIELAKKVAEAGILFVVDWAHNNGGVIAASVLWQLQEEATEEQLNPKIELPCRTNFRRLLEEAMEKGTTPTELVYEKVEKMVYSSDR
ncbi:MAG: Glu/Leu/Phe/Val dehydrogenase family protein [Deltaproteobacteria bacterium]|nr:Glu/Leu/Phe/Val dehydrogenase family protein [Deltaproteobacteria bacterium]